MKNFRFSAGKTLPRGLCLAFVAALVATVTGCGAGGNNSPAAGSNLGAKTEALVNKRLKCDFAPATSDVLLDWKVPKAKKPYKITLLNVSMSTFYYQGLAYGAQQAADASGVELTVVAGEGYSSPATQLQQVENAIQKGADAIVLVPSDIQGSVAVVEKAKAAGVKVVNISSEVNADAVTVLQDDITLGETIAEHLGSVAHEGKGIYMAGPATATWSLKRTVGFSNQLEAKFPKLTIADAPTQLVDPAAGLQSFNNAVQTHPDIKWIAGGYYLLLPPAALPSQYRGLPYVATGLEPESVDALKKGLLSGVISVEPIPMGKVGVTRAIELLNGDTPPKTTCLPAPYYTKDNLDTREAKAEMQPIRDKG
ncbi:sugar ABC transporter substrate-binding protein [Arthrobacter bambusae]|uniref:Ribose transport system substrate-binding protein n=1 Tax=Arthrobacter bambusae TaxID=1338426 RepID=A0AAW8DN81_9MICC|nr:sugar ABC transporter substrate-binding protein [Arthrobacter bambusae]MDP9907895.1 ribose transport system substrate-binding protein [Arthrobacter bambusae]MDQ0132086.1 ribose transport system substrate-binding protein [Arthrobacter bambusae]MDQ0183427.1 ribose transport system substrate-binding protein [Arthrobacter bambusae]